MTSRERFEAWYATHRPDCIFARFSEGNPWGGIPGNYTTEKLQWSWMTWKAAEAATARRCVMVIDMAPCDPDVSDQISGVIRAEYPEAFK